MTDLSNTELAVYGMIAVYSAKEFLVPLVKGSLTRNLQAKDELDKAVQRKLEEHDKQLADLKLAQATLTSSITSQLGVIEGKVGALDHRVEKQGLAHDQRLKDGLSDATTEFNRKLTATLNSELERTVREVLREELKRRES